MTTRKIYAMCKKLGLSTTYYVNIGHGFYDEQEGDPQTELEPRVMDHLRNMQLNWYECELTKLIKKDGLHLCTDLFLGEGLLVCDGGTKDNPWEGVTWYIRINPLQELWELYKEDIDNGPKMPDLKVFEKHCRQLARKHWKNKANYQREPLLKKEA